MNQTKISTVIQYRGRNQKYIGLSAEIFLTEKKRRRLPNIKSILGNIKIKV